MKLVRNLEIGQRIQALKFGKVVIGKILSKLPGAVVILNEKSDDKEIVDMDRINKVFEDETD
jgi:hypothetical protein